ncbi:MAG: hypothetical protein Q8P06_01035 [Candidatus Azambacteria bacterium]|nr:hypothetical protein [Candidatus Azambacteria bacterium]
MENFIHKIKDHWLAIIVALILGALMVLPFLYFQTKLRNNFKGIFPTIVNDENFYYARVNDVIDGHSFLSNAYLFEHKNGLPQQLFLAEWLLAQPIKIFKLNINTAHLIYNFLFPAVVFLLTYLALFAISKSRFWSVIFSTFLFFGLYLLSFIRPISPQFNFIFWLTQFIFLWLFIKNSSKLSKSDFFNLFNGLLFLNILNFGLLFYIYPYYWTFYLIFFGLLVAAYFFTDKALALKILVIAAGGLILAIPYFYLNYLSARLPYYTETLTRLGMIYSRFPSGFRIIFWSILGLAVFSCLLWRKIIVWDVKTIFFISGILASVIAVNQHLITGKNFEFSSHYDMAAMFFLIFAAAYLWRIFEEHRGNSKFLPVILLVIVLALSGNGLRDYSRRVFAVDDDAVYRQNYAPIFDWLNKNTAKDSVIYANVDLSMLVPVYTANNVYYIREANLFFISDAEVLDRFILNNFFSAKGGSQPKADQPLAGAKSSGGEYFNKDFIVNNDRSIYGVRYIDIYGHTVQANKLRRLFGLKPESEIYLPEEAIEKVIMRAEELQKGDFIEELKKFHIDYLIWDKNKNPNWKIDASAFKRMFQNGDLIIFKFLNL